jgi:hypothetical protein
VLFDMRAAESWSVKLLRPAISHCSCGSAHREIASRLLGAWRATGPVFAHAARLFAWRHPTPGRGEVNEGTLSEPDVHAATAEG